MIVFYGQGGLGNQLFQYAAARRLAIYHNTSLVLDPYWFYNPGMGETPRSLELNRYPVTMRLASPAEQARWVLMRGRLARYMKPLRRMLPMKLIKEDGNGINQEMLNAPAHSYLSGFWQSEAYFADIRNELLNELTPSVMPSKKDQEVINQINSSVAVSVHVRRGDYVTLKSASAYHGLCSLDYYHAAIQHIAERVKNPTLFIFSDDPEWTRSNLTSSFPTYYVEHNNAENAFQDLRLMALCQHHIIANSSFSWWGAWLAERQDGVVVAPERWYAGNRSTPDLIPARWTRISK